MDWWSLFRTVAVVQAIAAAEHCSSTLDGETDSYINATALFMDIVGVGHIAEGNSCGLSPPPTQWQKPTCREKLGCNIPLNCFNYSVLMINKTAGAKEVTPVELEQILENSSIPDANTCAVVMFYAPWCPYSVEFAPKFNALGRSFRELRVLGIDYSSNDPYKYLTAYLPLVNFYYKGKVIYRFKATETYEELLAQVAVMTDLDPVRVNLSDPENSHPVPTVRVDGDRIYLQLATLWVLLVCVVYICTTSTVIGWINRIAVRLKRTNS